MRCKIIGDDYEGTFLGWTTALGRDVLGMIKWDDGEFTCEAARRIHFLPETPPHGKWATGDPTVEGWYIVTVRLIHGRDIRQARWTGSEWDSTFDIIAWMPEPEVYRG